MRTTPNQGKLTCLFVFLLLTPLFVFAQKEDRHLTDFSKISLSISADLHLVQSNSYSVVLEGSNDDLEKIKTEVENNRLIIKLKKNNSHIGDVDIYVSMPNITDIDLAGSGSVVANKTVKVSEIDLRISGSGDIIFEDLQANETDAEITGSGDIKLFGKNKKELDISITGSGDLDASEFESNSVDVDITGSGSAKVFATENLETNIVGSGDVRYKGNPLVDASSVGSGKTRHL